MEQAPRTGGRAIPLALGLAAFVLYLATLAPGLMWGDSARFCERSVAYLPGAEPGEHHLRNWFGRLANNLPWGTIPWRQNLVSAVFGALAVAWVARVAHYATGSSWGAAIAAAAFAASHTHWHLSVICESYSLLAFLILVATEMLLRWQETGHARWAVRASFVCGLAAADHLFAFVLGPVLALFLVVGRPWPPGVVRALRWVPLLALAALLGYLPALVGGLCVHLETGRPWHDLVYDLLDLRGGKYFAGDLRDVFRFYGRSILFLGFQFPLLAGLLGLLGLVLSVRDGLRRAALPLLVFLMTFAWAGLYLQQRNVYLLLVGYAMFAIWIARGAEALRSWLKGKVEGPVAAVMAAVLLLVVVLPPILYTVTPALTRRFGISIAGAESLRSIRGRPATWILLPWKNSEDSADRFARGALQVAPPRSIIVCDFTPAAVLSYAQHVDGLRPDVDLVPLERALGAKDDMTVWLEANLGDREVFLASDSPAYRVDRLGDRYELTWCGPLLRVLRR
ncbi:MAG: DUF2723 domain-containing protein [Planctomycetota bacterium]